ncbi:hypothetical protein M8C21_008398 [Ambrosia artemisiifolia]|uniref:Uncharacterized protein n=1 Tax=Ambrosia artemisiifolia TaxID=4212 RepID=A0AAD5C153_AMBAR|nr:hypothetical protein M8C21_008398 [Ambrosia artemisiifolia]
MFEFGDELIINSHSIPWLIWIQLLAMLLLFILLYSFTATSSDLSTSSNMPSFVHTSADVSNRHNSKVRENERKETGPGPGPSTSTSEVARQAKKPDGRLSAGSSTTNESSEVPGSRELLE